mgnify:CR=1 FL=1
MCNIVTNNLVITLLLYFNISNVTMIYFKKKNDIATTADSNKCRIKFLFELADILLFS